MEIPRNNAFYEFEGFHLDAGHLLLCRNGQEVRLAPKVIETLLALVERPGEILSKDELMQIVWANSAVEEGNLSQNLYLLRKVLQKNVVGKPMIETLHRRGYRLNAKVQRIERTSVNTRDPGGSNLSIAVLPFANMSGDAENDYFCDGLSEELLNGLTKIHRLKVAARTSAFSFKNKNVETGEICRALGVNRVLEGSVRRSSDRLRITVQLVAPDGYHLWSERYDRKIQDVLDVQDEITAAVLAALKLELFGMEKAAVFKRGTDSTEAYEFYLRGLFHFYKRTTEDLKKAIKLFEHALEKDRNYALAYVGLTDCYLLVGVYSGVHASETLPPAKAAATRALAIDDSLAEAHAALGHYYFRSLEWHKAEREIRRAIELNSNYAAAHFWYSEYFRAQRSFNKALREIKQAQELDLLSPSIRTFVGLAHWNLGDADAAFGEWLEVVEIAPSFLMAHFFLTHAYSKLNSGEAAVEHATRAVDLSGRGSLFLGSLGYAYARAGSRVAALAVIAELKEKYAARLAGGFNLAQVYVGSEDISEAIFWLERDFQTGNTILLTNIMTGYLYDHLFDDFRYRELVRLIGVPADQDSRV